jgi:hypothetical protein
MTASGGAGSSGAGGNAGGGAGGASAGTSAAGVGAEAGIGGSAGAAGSDAAGSAGSAGAAGDGGAAGTSGAGGQAGAAGASGSAGTTGVIDCKGRAVAFSANGTGQASDGAYAHVEIDLGSDLPIGNANRSVEFWMYVKMTDWVGDRNEIYAYGTSGSAAVFGLDFGTDPVAGQPMNHATLNPFTGGGFDDDSTNDLGTTASSDHWVHVAMTWNGTHVITYVNGQPKITTAGSGATMLATGQSTFILGCNPTTKHCFSGMIDELRIWNVARTAQEIRGSFDKPVVGNEAGLVGYYKFDEMSGTTTADGVITAGHTAHPGTLRADTTAHRPTFLSTQAPLPLVCP